MPPRKKKENLDKHLSGGEVTNGALRSCVRKSKLSIPLLDEGEGSPTQESENKRRIEKVLREGAGLVIDDKLFYGNFEIRPVEGENRQGRIGLGRRCLFTERKRSQ